MVRTCEEEGSRAHAKKNDRCTGSGNVTESVARRRWTDEWYKDMDNVELTVEDVKDRYKWKR